MINKKTNELVNVYCRLRDRQLAVYAQYAKKFKLTANELFVLDILWFTPGGCTQKEICTRLSANKQTIAAITGRFLKRGYIFMEESVGDRRNKCIRFTRMGKEYAEKIIPCAALAENLAMERLGLQKIGELVRLTAQLTVNMEETFEKSLEDFA